MGKKDKKSELELHVKPEMFQELMPRQIQKIILISSLYNIYNMEDYGSLTSKIVNEYRCLNLSHPPKITGVFSVQNALTLLQEKQFDLVFMVPHLNEMEPLTLRMKIKEIQPDLPVIILSPSTRGIYPELKPNHVSGIDRIFIWSDNPDMLLAMIKNTEDHLNVHHDTQFGNVRVVILVEDSPEYASICFSSKALGNGIIETMKDIVYVKADGFKSNKTRKMAQEINTINADSSQGSHFFHNITSLGIPYITVNETLQSSQDHIDWQWLESLETVNETTFLRHVRFKKPLMVKIDGKQSWCVILNT